MPVDVIGRSSGGESGISSAEVARVRDGAGRLSSFGFSGTIAHGVFVASGGCMASSAASNVINPPSRENCWPQVSLYRS